MSLIKKLASETAIYGVSSILSRVLNYVLLTPFLTRIFTDSEYGVVSVMYSYAALLMVFFTYRMETAFFRFGSKEGNLKHVFSTGAICIIITTLIYVLFFVGFSQPIAEWIKYPDQSDYVILFTFIIAFDALSAIPFAKLRLENRAKRFAILKTLSILINIGAIFFFLWLCPYLLEQGNDWVRSFYNPDNRIAYVFISNLIASSAVILILLPEYFSITWRIDRALLKRMFIYAMPLIIVGIAAVINQLINLPLLKELLPGTPTENDGVVGTYAAATKIAILMSLFVQAFNYAAEPFFFRHADRKDSREIYAQVGQVFTMVASVAFLGIMMYIDLIQYLIGKDLRGGLGVVPILLVAFLFLGLYYNFSIWYKLTDNTKYGAYISVAGAIITLAINVSLIPVWGYWACAWAALVCYFFMAAASYLLGRKYYPIEYPVGRMLLYILGAVAFYLVGLFLRPYFVEQIVLLVIVNTLIVLAYLATLYFFERRNIQALLK